MEIVIVIMVYLVGMLTGMYTVSQMELFLKNKTKNCDNCKCNCNEK